MKDEYRVCARCVMDTSAPEISFNADGVCNFCSEFLHNAAPILGKSAADRDRELSQLVERIKTAAEGKPYDCIIGVSGGVDSSWVLVKAVELGLKPLAVHMDNGWNSELAQNNIANLVRGLGVDLYTHVIDWGEYRALMQAFFDADVIDVELLYDNAMAAVNYQQAAKYGLKFILGGTNQSTEGMAMPASWNWFKYDKKNIEQIARRFGGIKLKTFPAFSTADFIYSTFVRRIRWISFLDHFEYNKFDAMKTLEAKYGYKPYPYKHYESIFTRFYQGYILPQKFGVDKRRLHLATLIATGQLQREDALKSLEQIPYPSEADLEDDIRYFLKKMGWSRNDLQAYLDRPEKPHAIHGSEKPLWDFCYRVHQRYLRHPKGRA